MESIKTTTVKLSPVKVLTPNGFSNGLVTKRPATTREVRHIMKNILGIVVNERDDMYDKGAFYLGCYDIMIDEHEICYAKWCGAEIESTYVEMDIKDNLIDAAYELLCWCIENKFVETNKNE